MNNVERLNAIIAELSEASRLLSNGNKGALVLIQTARYTLADIEYSMQPQKPAESKPVDDDEPAIEIPICGAMWR